MPPMRTFFTADLHLGHKKLLEKYNGRPRFSSVEEMDDAIISNLNFTVTTSDRLYILGDFAMGNFEQVKAYRERINCKQVFLIKGNHDELSDTQYKRLFTWVGDLKDIEIDGQRVTLCHYAMLRWKKSHKGAWHLFGHSHGDLRDNGSRYAFDVGVDPQNFLPLSWEEVVHRMSARIVTPEPNHGGGCD